MIETLETMESSSQYLDRIGNECWAQEDEYFLSAESLDHNSTLVRDPSRYPACWDDSDCAQVSSEKGQEHKCYQYMCYPWHSREEPFRKCRRNRDCLELSEAEGGDGTNGKCYKHHERRSVR